MLLLLGFELADLCLENGVALIHIIGIFLDLLKSLLQSLQLLLMVFLLLVGFLQLEALMTETLLQLTNLFTQFALIHHILNACLMQHIELVLVLLRSINK